jgi:hypothetical protein
MGRACRQKTIRDGPEHAAASLPAALVRHAAGPEATTALLHRPRRQRADSGLRLFRGGVGTTRSGQVIDPRRSAAHRRQHRQAAGAIGQVAVTPRTPPAHLCERKIMDRYVGEFRALRVLKSAERVCFAEINLECANKMSDAMDDVLGRVKVAVAKGVLVEAIRSEISDQIERLNENDCQVGRVVERLRRAISDGSRSADVGMAGRLLREYVVAQILSYENTKQMTPFEIMQGLRSELVAEWVISYLNLLHAFGNEAAHHRTQNSHPPEIDSDDLAACLFAIQRVLDFWFGWRSST